VVHRKKTTTDGVVFLKDAERQGLTRPKKTIRSFAFDVDRGIHESEVRYAYAIVPTQKLEGRELEDKIEVLSQTRKDLKDTIKRQIEVKMVEHAQRNGLIHDLKKNERRTIDHMSHVTNVWLEAELDNAVNGLATATLIWEVLLGRFRAAEYAGWHSDCERQVMQCHNLSYSNSGLNDEKKAKPGAVYNAVIWVHAEIIKSWRKRAMRPKGHKWVLRVMGKQKNAAGHAVRDTVPGRVDLGWST
jgi:hypothetical protein